jgi:stage V sporulation protein G
MPIIDVKTNSMYPPGVSGGIRAYASATVEGCRDGIFVSMPSRKTENGYKEICFPVTKEFREQLHKAVLDSYQQATKPRCSRRELHRNSPSHPCRWAVCKHPVNPTTKTFWR